MSKSAIPRGGRKLTVNVKTAKKRSLASAEWLRRQLNDPYVVAAKEQGWRSRAAFKLLELDDRFHVIRRGASAVVGVDLLPMDPIPGSTLMVGDFNDPELPERLAAELGGRADLV